MKTIGSFVCLVGKRGKSKNEFKVDELDREDRLLTMKEFEICFEWEKKSNEKKGW